MAFVFEEPRWKKQPEPQNIGPGSYTPQKSSFSSSKKFCVISPEKKNCSIAKPLVKNQQLADAIVYYPERKVEKRTCKRKPFKRAQTAKLFPTSRQQSLVLLAHKLENQAKLKENKQQTVCPETVCHESSSILNQKDKQFQNSFIKTSIKKHNQLIQSQQYTAQIKQTFSDAKLRSPTYHKSNFPYSFSKQTDSLEGGLYASTGKLKNKFCQNFVAKKESKTIKQNNFIVPVNKKKQVSQRFFITTQKQNFQQGNSSNETMMKSIETFPLANREHIQAQRKSNKKSKSIEDMQRTRIQDSSKYEQEDSIQYIEECTPGPGHYAIGKQPSMSCSSGVQSFGVTQTRFKDKPSNTQNIKFLNQNPPNFKKTSKASQEKIAFSKVRPSTCKPKVEKENLVFYDDPHSIEQKCLKTKIHFQHKSDTFYLKKDRFIPKKEQEYNGPDFFQKDHVQKPTLSKCAFKSKVDRNILEPCQSSNADYAGQDFNTIQRKLSKQNQRKQIQEVKQLSFSASASRFKYDDKTKENSPSKQTKTKRKQIYPKPNPTAYTFSKERKSNIFKNSSQTVTPTPWAYSTTMKWIKSSHHVKYRN